MVTVMERMLQIEQKENIQFDQIEEQIKIAEKLGLKGMAWALKKRFQFNTLKALGYPQVTFIDIEKIFNINKETHEVETAMFSQDYGFLHYTGLMPRGALLTINELVQNKICNAEDFKIFYPVKKPARRLSADPILCIHILNMDILPMSNLARDEGRRDGPDSVEDENSKMTLFKVWQWE